MKKTNVFVICILAVVIILCGCHTSASIDEYEKLSKQCIDNDENMLLELFNMYDNDILLDISQIDNEENTDKGIVIDYNNKKYYIITSEGKDADPSNKDYIRACEIMEHLINTYPITSINYYPNPGNMEIWFKENYADVDYGIVYYPPDVEADVKTSDDEYFDKIKDGFYFYILYYSF